MEIDEHLADQDPELFPYDRHRVDGVPQCVHCGENLDVAPPDPEGFCSTCGLPTGGEIGG